MADYGSPSLALGHGAETHQRATGVPTTNHGMPVSDNQKQLGVVDTFGHLKAIGFNAVAKPLLDKAEVEPDEGVADIPGFVEAAKRRHRNREPKVRTLA